MEASKNIDCYGCFPGHSIEQADAEQAYVQADLTGNETWMAIPEEAWRDSWWKNGTKLQAIEERVLNISKARAVKVQYIIVSSSSIF